MSTLEDLKSRAREVGSPATFQDSLLSSNAKKEQAAEKKLKTKKEHWESPIEIDCVSDMMDPILIESLSQPDKYKYASKKSMKNFNELFIQCIDMLEDLE